MTRRSRTTSPRRLIRLHYAASERDADMLYATGFSAPDPFLFLQVNGQRLMAVSDLELDRARSTARVRHVLRWSEYERQVAKAGTPSSPARVIAAILSARGIRRCAVPQSFSHGLAVQLADEGIQVTPLPDPFWPARERKEADEVRSIIRAQRAAEAGLAAGLDLLRHARIGRDGYLYTLGRRLAAEGLRHRIDAAVLAHGAVAAHTICACGPQSVDPHEQGHGPLRAHQPIIIDVFPRSEATGYHGDLTRTVVRGHAGDRLCELYATVRAGVRMGLASLRPRASGQEIHRTILDFFTSRGFPTGDAHGRMEGFFHGTGHGVGLEIHEAPSIGPRRPSTLRRGHVVTIEPGLYYSELGGLRIEELALVEQNGCRNLTRAPHVFEL
jgi:Xaa-Pro aminopeptidase